MEDIGKAVGLSDTEVWAISVILVTLSAITLVVLYRIWFGYRGLGIGKGYFSKAHRGVGRFAYDNLDEPSGSDTALEMTDLSDKPNPLVWGGREDESGHLCDVLLPQGY